MTTHARAKVDDVVHDMSITGYYGGLTTCGVPFDWADRMDAGPRRGLLVVEEVTCMNCIVRRGDVR